MRFVPRQRPEGVAAIPHDHHRVLDKLSETIYRPVFVVSVQMVNLKSYMTKNAVNIYCYSITGTVRWLAASPRTRVVIDLGPLEDIVAIAENKIDRGNYNEVESQKF